LRSFDPKNNRCGEGKIDEQDQISLLISTDVLSVVRAGRVDRIGIRHEVIKIVNFLPDPIIENDLQSPKRN
jgi:hypothetical protein